MKLSNLNITIRVITISLDNNDISSVPPILVVHLTISAYTDYY
jgi:hypothetical protein